MRRLCRLLNPDSRLQSASNIVSNVAISLSTCPSDYYVVVSQSGVSSQDYGSIKNTPVLAQALSGHSARGIRSSMVVPDVTGSIDSSSWTDLLRSKCGVQVTEIDGSKGTIPATISSAPRLLKVTLPKPSSQRQNDLAHNDAFFASVLDMLPTQNYTVLYTTARSGVVEVVEPKEYDMESQVQESLHIDLKRDLGLDARAGNGAKNNQTMIDGPLFDKYQFFTPGKSKFCGGKRCIANRKLTLHRYLHGSSCFISVVVDPVRGRVGTCVAASYLRCIRQGDGSIGGEEATMIELRASVMAWD